MCYGCPEITELKVPWNVKGQTNKMHYHFIPHTHLLIILMMWTSYILYKMGKDHWKMIISLGNGKGLFSLFFSNAVRMRTHAEKCTFYIISPWLLLQFSSVLSVLETYIHEARIQSWWSINTQFRTDRVCIWLVNL